MERLIDSKRLKLANDTQTPLVVLLNNLGSTSQLEMGILQSEILKWLSKSFYLESSCRCAKKKQKYLVGRGHKVLRFYSGGVTTSLDSHGVSVSILKVVDNQWLELLDTPGKISSLWQTSTPSRQLLCCPEPSLRQVHVSIEDIGVQVSIREFSLQTIT